ncbi:MAG: glycosyltransferase [Erysipelotrichaceae bacterium]|nr:glycosyltransferase [Erysipelotrichaceae bacterium]
MRILNICVNGIYTDYMSYHENLLPKYHKKNGHDVFVLASEFFFDENGLPKKCDKNEYVDNNGVIVKRLKIKDNHDISYRLKKFANFYHEIETIKPDIIFCHLFQFLDAYQVLKYQKKHPEVVLYFDSHADYSNSATTWISKHILHGLIWKRLAKKAAKQCKIFYGVLPARVDFLKERYGLSSNKIKLLPMGADDELVKKYSKAKTISEVRTKYGYSDNDFVIAFGGKIDNSKKQVLNLMRVVKNLNENIKLIIFGSVEKELKEEFYKLSKCDRIKYLGWLNSEDSYPVFACCNLACFPGRHSVFWEQVVAQGIPLLVKHWDGIQHINLGGNVRYLYTDSEKEIKEQLSIIVDCKEYEKMKNAASSPKKDEFLYSNLARKSIEE